MPVLKVFAAFWAADKTEEKKPVEGVFEPGFPEGLGDDPSGVGVGGANVVLDSLLGPAPPEPG